ncbi:Mn2+/Fe2+ NRAMP family transporter [Methanomicrobium sp. W14]|uniref:Nramp family divalent metal transporter n=1 Tax=Methanomicrobium sp. W14 TaxID=2817839 RepID=UPI001AE7E799|nr:Nramp family divalent metal transporter [Methanomicrobium sp. W14]MBP2133055.1 Mn2+/Fe2+ NRAMP family transporter [Methanomicrobium sp. W14]
MDFKIKTKIPEFLSGRMKFIGPGLLLAIAAAGESGISEALEIGAHYHFALIWVIVLTLVFKFAFTNGIARYTLSTGDTIFEGLKTIPGPKNWTVVFVTLIFLLEMFAFGGMLLFGAIFLDYYLPGVYLENLLALLTLAVTLFLLWKDSYERVEKVVIAIAICLFVGIGYCLLEFSLPFGSIALGLIPKIPHGSVLSIMALMGAVGSGLNLLLYSVWLSEKSRGEHGPAYFRRYISIVNLDIAFAFVIVALITILFLTLGVSGFVVSFIGQGEELTLDAIIVQVLYVLSNIPFGDSFFLIFGYLIMFGATITGMDGRARAISSVIKSSSKTKLSEIQLYRIILGVFTVIIASAIFWGEPSAVIHTVSAVAAIMFALLGFMLIYIDLNLPEYARGNRVWLLVMTLGSSVFLLMALIMEGSFISVGLPLIERLVLLIVPVYIFMKTDLFKKCINKNHDIYDLLWVILIFGAISVYGTFRGIPVDNITINVGHVGPMIAGFICGPFAGFMAGAIGGAYILSTGEMYSEIFAAGTIFAGIFPVLMLRLWKENLTYSRAAVVVVIAEVFNFIVIPLLFGVGLTDTTALVRKSFLPTLIANMTGVLIFVYFLKEGRHSNSFVRGEKGNLFKKNSECRGDLEK